QRGGTPDVYDVVLADRFAFESVSLIEKKEKGLIIGCENGRVYPYPIKDAIKKRRVVTDYYLQLASMLID
ncbi:MAG TPA: hypothetical protein PLN45_02890, partial [Exilispira sp.]|nr:hypothetical protein [Exilispira sp.]